MTSRYNVLTYPTITPRLYEDRIAQRQINEAEYLMWIWKRNHPEEADDWWPNDYEETPGLLQDAYWMPNYYACKHRDFLQAEARNTIRWYFARKYRLWARKQNEFQMLLLKLGEMKRGLGIDFYRNIRTFF